MMLIDKLQRSKAILGLLTMMVLLLTSASHSHAQDGDGAGFYLGAFYGFHGTGGDLSDRFGGCSSAGVSMETLVKQRWTFGLEGHFYFGNNVEENPFGDLITDRGQVITEGFTQADLDIKMRGYQLLARAGYIFDLGGDLSVSGPTIRVGVGYLRHQIRIREGQDGVPLLLDPYLKGYDRSTDGLSLYQFIGYQHFDGSGKLNVFAGLELTQGLTSSRRGLNYDTNTVDDDSRVDMLIGARFGIQVTLRAYGDQREILY